MSEQRAGQTGPLYLVPELCNTTGLSDEQRYVSVALVLSAMNFLNFLSSSLTINLQGELFSHEEDGRAYQAGSRGKNQRTEEVRRQSGQGGYQGGTGCLELGLLERFHQVQSKNPRNW